MSDTPKAGGLGVFVNKKNKTASGGGAAPVVGGAVQKNVPQRLMYVGAAVIGVVVLSTAFFSNKQDVAPSGPKKPEAMINVTPPNADKVAFEAKFGKDMEAFKASLEQLKSENAALREAQKQAQDNAKNAANSKPLPAGVVPPPSQSNAGGLGVVGSDVPPPPPTATVRGGIPVPAGAGNAGASLPPVTPSVNSAPMVFEFKENAAAANGIDPKLPSVASKVSYKKNDAAGMLPAGGFAPVALLNGLDAGTSAATQSSPMPVLMNITDQATLPGSAKYKLKSCFALGNGYGDLSAERVYVRVSRLSCVDKNQRLILSQEVAGYVVDSDGKLGLRGKVMDRQGARLGKALLAGFAQGLSGALGNAQGTVTSNLSTGSTMSSLSGSAALRQSGLSGAQTAAQQIAEFYLREAQAIFPVVSIDTGRTGTVVFQNSVSLNWTTGETQFVQDVKPN